MHRPLGFDIFPGNRNEQLTLKPIEKKILQDFEIENASLIVCTDAGLASTDNKVFNAVSHVTDSPESQLKTDFITILPLKKMKGKELAWATARGRSLISDPIPLENSGFPMSSGKICNALRQALLVPLPSKNYKVQSFLNVGLSQSFNNKDVEKPGRERKELNDTVDEEQVWSAFEKEREARPDDLDLILKTAGLKPLKVFNTMTEIKNNLGLSTCPNEVMISKCHLRYLSKVTAQM